MNAKPNNPDQDASRPEPSPELISQLRGTYARGPKIPSEVDQRILDMARKQMGSSPRAGASRPGVLASIGTRRVQIGGGIAALVAASLAVAFWIFLPDLGRDDLAFEGTMSHEAESLLGGEDLARSDLSKSFADSAEAESDDLRSLDSAQPRRANRLRSDAPAAAPNDLGFANKLADRDAGAPLTQALEEREERNEPQRGDIDRNGTVNILDALALARVVEAGEQPGAAGARNQWDMNSDGRIDASDVSAIAIAAVSLDQQPAKGGA